MEFARLKDLDVPPMYNVQNIDLPQFVCNIYFIGSIISCKLYNIIPCNNDKVMDSWEVYLEVVFIPTCMLRVFLGRYDLKNILEYSMNIL